MHKPAIGKDGNPLAWIPVDDELPMTGISVFAATEEYDPEILEYWRRGPDHDGASGWYDADGEKVDGVTHWMALPGNPNQ